jgi:hypothetical protein
LIRSFFFAAFVSNFYWAAIAIFLITTSICDFLRTLLIVYFISPLDSCGHVVAINTHLTMHMKIIKSIFSNDKHR